jgi:hypothetical protein
MLVKLYVPGYFQRLRGTLTGQDLWDLWDAGSYTFYECNFMLPEQIKDYFKI